VTMKRTVCVGLALMTLSILLAGIQAKAAPSAEQGVVISDGPALPPIPVSQYIHKLSATQPEADGYEVVFDDGFAWNVHDRTTAVRTLTAPDGRKAVVWLGVTGDYYHILHTDLVYRKLHNAGYPRQETWKEAITGNDIGRLQEIIAAHPALLNPPHALDTPLISATFFDKADMLAWLVHDGAKVNLPNSNGQTALMQAASFNKLDVARILIDAGANVNQKDNFGETALKNATQMGSRDVAALLVQHGATK
jgi:hypothetical protein